MYHFKQAVCFPGKKGGKDAKGLCLPDGPSLNFKCGQKCDVPKEVEQHSYFQSLLKSGQVEEVVAKPAPKPAAKAEPEKPKEDPKKKK